MHVSAKSLSLLQLTDGKYNLLVTPQHKQENNNEKTENRFRMTDCLIDELSHLHLISITSSRLNHSFDFYL